MTTKEYKRIEVMLGNGIRTIYSNDARFVKEIHKKIPITFYIENYISETDGLPVYVVKYLIDNSIFNMGIKYEDKFKSQKLAEEHADKQIEEMEQDSLKQEKLVAEHLLKIEKMMNPERRDEQKKWENIDTFFINENSNVTESFQNIIYESMDKLEEYGFDDSHISTGILYSMTKSMMQFITCIVSTEEEGQEVLDLILRSMQKSFNHNKHLIRELKNASDKLSV